MPCHCWVSESEIEPEMKIIRDHMKEIVKLVKIIDGRGDLSPSEKTSPAPRHVKDDVHKLLDDLYTGKCQEKPNEVD